MPKTSRVASVAPVTAYDEAAAVEALVKIEKILAKPKAKAPSGLEADIVSAMNVQDLCKLYGQVKPLLGKALPLIGLIPVYGAKVVLAVTLLMKIADRACPVS